MLKTLPTLTDDEIQRCPTPGSEAGFGALTGPAGPLPLKALGVATRIDGLICQVDVEQTFVNTHDEAVEATYIFPLPDRAAVTRFRLEVAGRVVEGQLKERGAARQEYDQAIEAGHRAAITEEERPGVFTMRVGNLPPGEAARVYLSLIGPLPYGDGEVTFRFPLVVAPRYIPGQPLPGSSVGDGVAPDTDAVPDASRISPPVLLPGYPNPVRLSLSVEFSSTLAPRDLRSSLHTLVEEDAGWVRRVALQPGERLNRDFILRFRLAEQGLRTGLSVQPDPDGQAGTFLLTLTPPAGQSSKSSPRDVVFVLDRSGSMEGWKIVAARRAMARMVETLTDRDRFSVIAFDSTFESPTEFDGQLVWANDRHRFQAAEFLGRIQARGGTEMAAPLERAVDDLSRLSQPDRQRIVVLVTDGQVGNEDQILRHLGPRAKDIRIFTLGIDRAVNAAFLRRLSDLGGGSSELVESEDRLEEVMDRVHRLIGTPVLTALKLEAAGLKVVPGSVTPARLPDLFADAPLLVLGRYAGAGRGGISLQARDAGGQMWQTQVQPGGESGPALSRVWARARLRELEDRYVVGADDRAALEKEILDVSLRFAVLCRFTAFVAVDRASVVNPGGVVHSLTQPIEQPQGWGQACPPMAACLAAPAAPPMAGRGGGMGIPESQVACDGAARGASNSMRKRRQSSNRQAPPAPGSPPADKAKQAAQNKSAEVTTTDFDPSEAKERSIKGDRQEDKLTQALFGDVLGYDVTELWQALQGCPTTCAVHRLELLRSLHDKLARFLRDQAGATQGQSGLLDRLEALVMASAPEDQEVNAVWTELEKVLRDHLDGLKSTEKRGAFWK